MKKKTKIYFEFLLAILVLIIPIASASASLEIHSNGPSSHISPMHDQDPQGCQCRDESFVIYPGTGTISSALKNAKDGDVWILLKGAYYDNAVINKSISIKGAGPERTIVDGTDLPGSVFTVEPTKKVVLAGMTIQKGVGTNLEGFHAGGGVFNKGTLTLKHVTVTDNNDLDIIMGGGIYNAGTLNLDNALITNNRATYGAGIYNDGSEGAAVANMNWCSSIAGNMAHASGGGIYNIAGKVNMNEGSLIANNTAIWAGGILNDGAGDLGPGYLTIVDMNKGSKISHNTAYNDGGGIYNSGHGGKVVVNMSQDSSIDRNKADYYGGGIYNDGQHGTTTVNMNHGSFIDCNIADYYGGGIYNDGDRGIATVNMNEGSSITRNKAEMPAPSGGGIYSANNSGTARINQKPCSSIICNKPDNIVSIDTDSSRNEERDSSILVPFFAQKA